MKKSLLVVVILFSFGLSFRAQNLTNLKFCCCDDSITAKVVHKQKQIVVTITLEDSTRVPQGAGWKSASIDWNPGRKTKAETAWLPQEGKFYYVDREMVISKFATEPSTFAWVMRDYSSEMDTTTGTSAYARLPIAWLKQTGSASFSFGMQMSDGQYQALLTRGYIPQSAGVLDSPKIFSLR